MNSMTSIISEMCSTRPLRVGYWWSSKKSLKFKYTEFADVCRAHGIDLAKLDFESPLEDQGPFDAIVHKLSNCMLQAKAGDPQAKDICDKFREYVDKHPNIVVIDPLDKVEILLNRYNQYKVVQENELGLKEEEDIFIPAFVELTSTDVKENLAKMRAGGLDFPIVCKPSLAHGSVAHEMCLVFNESGLHDIRPPCVVQKFINHNAVLHKIFTIGDKYFTTRRPSLKNFHAGDQKTIFFNSHLVSKADSASELTELDEEGEEDSLHSSASPKKMGHIAAVLGRCLDLTLLGVDIIVDNRTGRHAIIDINPFPGYDEVDNFFKLLIDVIVSKVSAVRCRIGGALPYHALSQDALQEDSGIETSDSCDEKKQKTAPCRPVKRLHSRNHNCATGDIG